MTASCLSVLVRLLLTTVLLPTRRLHTEVLSSTCTVVQNVVLIVPYILYKTPILICQHGMARSGLT